MSLSGILVERDGALFVAYESAMDSEPTIVTLYWRVEGVTGNGYGRRPAAGDSVRADGGGPWYASDPASKQSTGTVSTGPGDEQAEHVERRPCPAPKVRRGVDVRWRHGSWEKLLAKGWVRA